MASQRALLIVNRKARNGNADLATAIDYLREQGVSILEKPADRPEEFATLIGRHAGEVDLVILGGGDGTMNVAAEAMVESGLPLGILPMGTANDLARTLGIPASPIEASEVIAKGIQHRIDLGCANGKLFFNVASIGLSVGVTRRLTGDVKRRWGVLGYGKSFLDTYKATRTFTARIKSDEGAVSVRSIQISVGNGRFYGGGMEVSDQALIDDGLLDLYSLAPISMLRLIAVFPAFRRGRHRRLTATRHLRAAAIEIETDRPMAVNTDGELTTRTPVRVHVVPKALAVFVPDMSAPGLKGTENAA